jgi:signal transduction histidine kinase
MQPFWSGSGGMGLGLTQAKLAAQSQGASLRLDAERGGLRTEVRWPAP